MHGACNVEDIDLEFRPIMRWIIAALYIAAGIAHLTIPDKLLAITPSWVPLAPEIIFVTGLFEIGAAVALVAGPGRYGAGIALAVYALCVWPANFKHAFDGVMLPHIPNSWLYHGPRLALQPVLMWWSLYCADVIDWPLRRGERGRNAPRRF